jgi:hypothetical protein
MVYKKDSRRSSKKTAPKKEDFPKERVRSVTENGTSYGLWQVAPGDYYVGIIIPHDWYPNKGTEYAVYGIMHEPKENALDELERYIHRGKFTTIKHDNLQWIPEIRKIVAEFAAHGKVLKRSKSSYKFIPTIAYEKTIESHDNDWDGMEIEIWRVAPGNKFVGLIYEGGLLEKNQYVLRPEINKPVNKAISDIRHYMNRDMFDDVIEKKGVRKGDIDGKSARRKIVSRWYKNHKR